jgi:hypothetical protein
MDEGDKSVFIFSFQIYSSSLQVVALPRIFSALAMINRYAVCFVSKVSHMFHSQSAVGWLLIE